MTIRFSMSANEDVLNKIKQQPPRTGCSIVYWENLEELKDALGPGITVETTYDPAEHSSLYGFLRFLITNKEMIRKQVREEKDIRVEMSREEMKSLASHRHMLTFGLCAPALRFLAELGADVVFYSEPSGTE
ncbi:MAG: hypothetical protein ACO1OO_13010 [Flavisolibacter sp.]